MIQSSIIVTTGLAIISLIGAVIAIGIVYATILYGLEIKPILHEQLIFYAILGFAFAFAHAMALFVLMMAFLLLYSTKFWNALAHRLEEYIENVVFIYVIYRSLATLFIINVFDKCCQSPPKPHESITTILYSATVFSLGIMIATLTTFKTLIEHAGPESIFPILSAVDEFYAECTLEFCYRSDKTNIETCLYENHIRVETRQGTQPGEVITSYSGITEEGFRARQSTFDIIGAINDRARILAPRVCTSSQREVADRMREYAMSTLGPSGFVVRKLLEQTGGEFFTGVRFGAR